MTSFLLINLLITFGIAFLGAVVGAVCITYLYLGLYKIIEYFKK